MCSYAVQWVDCVLLNVQYTEWEPSMLTSLYVHALVYKVYFNVCSLGVYYGTPFATKFRQNVIGVCIQYKIDFWRSIFNNRFFTVDFRFTRERSLTIDLIIDYWNSNNRFLKFDFWNRFLIIDYWNSIFNNQFLKIYCNWLILASNPGRLKWIQGYS